MKINSLMEIAESINTHSIVTYTGFISSIDDIPKECQTENQNHMFLIAFRHSEDYERWNNHIPLDTSMSYIFLENIYDEKEITNELNKIIRRIHNED